MYFMLFYQFKMNDEKSSNYEPKYPLNFYSGYKNQFPTKNPKKNSKINRLFRCYVRKFIYHLWNWCKRNLFALILSITDLIVIIVSAGPSYTPHPSRHSSTPNYIIGQFISFKYIYYTCLLVKGGWCSYGWLEKVGGLENLSHQPVQVNCIHQNQSILCVRESMSAKNGEIITLHYIRRL